MSKNRHNCREPRPTHVTCARTLLSFSFAVCKSFYLQRAKVFTGSVQKFLFAACKRFHLQRAKVFICSVQTFSFAACKSFHLQRANVFICSVQKFLFAACKSFHLQRATVLLAACKSFYLQCAFVICRYTGIQDYYYLLRDILIVCKFHIINSIFKALQHFYLMKVLSLLGHRTCAIKIQPPYQRVSNVTGTRPVIG